MPILAGARLPACGFLLVLLLCACGSAAPVDGPDDALPDAAVDADVEPADGASPETAAPCLPPDPAPGTTARGDRLDGWAWTRGGRVLDAWPGAAPLDGWIAPALAEADGTMHLFVTRKEGLRHRIHHATSPDGAAFTVPREVRGLGDGEVVAYPSVLFQPGGGFRAWLTRGWIDTAASPDGDDWTVDGVGVLRPTGGDAFDAVSVLYPTVLREPAGYRMWFTGFDGRTFAVGHAASSDGRSWARSPDGPVLVAGAPADFDNRAVAQPCVRRGAGPYRMWYGGYDTSLTDPGPYRIGLAESEDGVAWSKRGVSLDLAGSGEEAWSTRDPAVISGPTGWRMVYAALGDDSRYRLFRATSPVCPD